MNVGNVTTVIALAASLAFLTTRGATAQGSRFALGADISALDAPSRFGRVRPAYQEDGKASDELTILMRHGWTAFRLRVFVSPVREAPDNSLANTIPLAKRIKAAGATFLLDIHYSDTWADPQHQEIPVAWRELSFDSLEAQVERYSRETIGALKDAGAMPDWVQVGNEITRGTLWPPSSPTTPTCSDRSRRRAGCNSWWIWSIRCGRRTASA
jgi:arabinogalactan endo-1,4-beta-galactosidase